MAGKRSLLSSHFLGTQLTLAPYVPTKGKAVIVLYTEYDDERVEGEDRKPETILHYNEKKRGVDNIDHFASIFTCHRKTNRWPMVLFYNMLGVAGVAAFGVCVSLKPDWA